MSSFDEWRERGADLAPRAAERSRASARTRWERLRGRLFFIGQCGVAAAVAWWFAFSVVGHRQPFFAPVTAMIGLGMSYGQRLRRVLEVMVGVAVGVFIGDVFIHFFGSGVWQIAVVCIVSMCLAALVGAGTLMTTQAGVQSVIVTTLVAPPGYAFSRWLDAVIGGGVALLFALVAPASPVRRPRQQAARVVREMSAVLRDTATALENHDDELASATLDRVRASEGQLAELREAADEGIAVVRLSPFRRRSLPGVQAIADFLEPLDRAQRNLRVLVRRAEVATWRKEPVPPAYVDMVATLAEVTDDIARELQDRQLPTHARNGLLALGESTAQVDQRAGLSTEVMRAQVRSMVVDLLTLTGMDYEEARSLVPESTDLEH